MKTAAILGGKGGSTKTATTHLLCLGACLSGVPSAYVLTDPMRKVRSEGRPYSVLDGRLPEQLALLFDTAAQHLNGYLFIDGGGNRPQFDIEVAKQCDFSLVPFRASEEDIDSAAASLQSIPNAYAWPSAWPTNVYAADAAQYLIDGLSNAFPLRVIVPAIPFVNSISDLLSSSLATPSSATKAAARRAFDTLTDCIGTEESTTPRAKAAG